MLEIKQTTYKGTRILLGNEKRELINNCISILRLNGFEEIQIPIIQHRELFKGKVGIENTSMMFTVKDNNPERDLVLAPEYTAVVQQLAKTTFKHQKDVKMFYVAECFRGESPQAGRYRQFTQLGVEILNPSQHYDLFTLAQELCCVFGNPSSFITNLEVTRGLDYYKNGKGFEITCDELGSSKQVCGGGEYNGGVGFALGIDRLLNLKINNQK